MSIEVAHLSNGIAVVTLRNPDRRNALNEPMFRQLAALWPDLATSTTRCVLLTGEGEAFSSGADLTADLHHLPDIDELVERALLTTFDFPKPIVAAIHGAAVAGGFELALAADVRICTTQAVFGLPEARWGIFPAGGGVAKLGDEIGLARARDLLLTGRLIGAEEAKEIGFVSEIVSPADLQRRAMEIAGMIASNSPAAVTAIKRYLNASRLPSAELRSLEASMTLEIRNSADREEGVAAFLAKRAPAYRDPS